MVNKKEGHDNDSKENKSLAIEDEDNSFFSNGAKNHTIQSNIINTACDIEYLNEKGEKLEELESPFPSDESAAETNFDEEKVRKHLTIILPEKDHHLIDHIINDKKYYYPNNLTIEKGIFRENGKGDLLDVVTGTKEGFTIHNHIKEIGTKNGLSTLGHNHINGLIMPSPDKDIFYLNLLKSRYSPIYSPNKTGLLVNSNPSKNQINIKKIDAKYNEFFDSKKHEIEKLYPEKVKNLKDKFSGNELDKRLADDLYMSYFGKNQVSIIKEINAMFKKNNFDLKLYIYYEKESNYDDYYVKS